MTCIAGLVDSGKVWLAGDRAASAEDGTVVVTISEPKVFRYGEMVIGAAGSFRTVQILKHAVRPPRSRCKGDPAAFLVIDFIPTWRRALKAHGGLEEVSGGALLVGLKGRLFEVGDDFGVTEESSGFGAVGSGSAYARGAWHVMQKAVAGEVNLAVAVLTRALDAAAAFTPGVRAPYDVVST